MDTLSLSLFLSPFLVVIGYMDCSTVCHTEVNKMEGIYIYVIYNYIKWFQQNVFALLPSSESRKMFPEIQCVAPNARVYWWELMLWDFSHVGNCPKRCRNWCAGKRKTKAASPAISRNYCRNLSNAAMS